MMPLECPRHALERNIQQAVDFFLSTKTQLAKLLTERIFLLKQLHGLNYVSIAEFIAMEKDLLLPTSSKCTMIVCGLLKAGKSTFVNEFLRGIIQLPCDEMPCTGRFVRIKYSETPYMVILSPEGTVVRTCEFDGKHPSCSEIDLPEKHRENEVELRSIVEIGIPHPMLQTGLEIIDCPALGESATLSRIFDDVVTHFNPDIVIYVFDHRLTFAVGDCATLDRIKSIISSHECRVFFVANKVDVNLDAKKRDGVDNAISEEEEEDDDEEEEAEEEKEHEMNGQDATGTRLATHCFNRDKIKTSIQHHYPNVSESDIFKISANMIYDHRYTKKLLEPFLSFEVALESGISQIFRTLALEAVERREKTMAANTLKVMNILIMAAGSFIFMKGHSESQLEDLRCGNLPGELDVIHKFLADRFMVTLKAKWNVGEYDADIRRLTEDNSSSGTPSQHMLLDSITTFMSDQFSNVVTHVLQLIRQDPEVCQQIEKFEQKLRKLSVWMNPWLGPLKNGKETGRFLCTVLTKACLQCFGKSKTAYVQRRGKNLPSELMDLTVDYFEFLKEHGETENAAMEYFNTLAREEKKQLEHAIQIRVEIMEGRITEIIVDEQQNKEMWNICGKLCHNILNVRSLCVDSVMKDTLSQIAMSENKMDLTAGFTLHSTELDGRTRYVLMFSSHQDPALMERIPTIASDLIYFQSIILSNSSGFFCVPKIFFSDANADIYIVSGSPKNQLLSHISSMSNGVKMEWLQTIFQELRKVHQDHGTLRNLRPDAFEISQDGDGDWNNLKMNLYCPCNPTLPIILGNHVLAPPFHIHPALLETYPFVTPSQEIYAFGWMIWIMLEGTGCKVPTVFENLQTAEEVVAHVEAVTKEHIISSALDELNIARDVWGDTFDGLKQLMQFCWTVPIDATRSQLFKDIDGLVSVLSVSRADQQHSPDP